MIENWTKILETDPITTHVRFFGDSTVAHIKKTNLKLVMDRKNDSDKKSSTF